MISKSETITNGMMKRKEKKCQGMEGRRKYEIAELQGNKDGTKEKKN